jgi:predicted nucleic acid-binding protein
LTYLVDTNVLIRVAFRNQAMHPIARAAVLKLRQNGEKLLSSSQSCVEFWNVATRPQANNGLGVTIAEANRVLHFVERVFTRIPDSPDVYPAWRNLVLTFGVSGAKVYDARLVALMQVQALTHILTFNTQDFVRYANIGIVAIDPSAVEKGQ